MAFILKCLISALLVPAAFSKRILDGKYASDINSEDFMVVFIVNSLNGVQTVDVIYRCDQDYGGVAVPFPLRPGSDSNEYIIDVGSAARLHTEIRELCSISVALADGDLLTLKKNSDGILSTRIENKLTPLERVDANFASAFRYRSDDMHVDIIQFTYDRTPKRGPSKTWSDEEYSPLSYYGNAEHVFTCKGTTMRFGSLELLREEYDFPFVEYIVGED
ncbi:hypothetical protein FOZ61_004637 [Perkinsus olseni]|uniref:Uncharacterized protein n=1 Tax=Perkinsus olseni TaxID=32597 RepID=A0A7J6LJY6_PEROL|nr:hypothetical protein FOZ61_004637 [Perkinsus olseni]KAF4664204.1 hypothetical protein FOL46_004360 [Perkinsus olseni]